MRGDACRRAVCASLYCDRTKKVSLRVNRVDVACVRDRGWMGWCGCGRRRRPASGSKELHTPRRNFTCNAPFTDCLSSEVYAGQWRRAQLEMVKENGEGWWVRVSSAEQRERQSTFCAVLAAEEARANHGRHASRPAFRLIRPVRIDGTETTTTTLQPLHAFAFTSRQKFTAVVW